MKKSLLFGILCSLVALVAPVSQAMTRVYNGNLANESALSYNASYPLNLSNQGQNIDYLSFQVTGTSATVSNATWTDGTKSTGSVTVSSNPVAGISGAIVCVNSTCVPVRWASTSTGTAKNISDDFMASTPISSILTSTWTSSVVYATSTLVGTSQNFVLFSSTNAALGLSGVVTTSNGQGTSAMTGGTNSGTTLNSAVITVGSSPYTPADQTAQGALALPVLYTSGTVTVGGLTNQTTYYVIPINSTSFKLASSAVNAVAGTGIVITSSSSQTTAHTFTLAALAISGTPSLKWQTSDDGSTWTDLSTSSTTFSSYTLGGATSIWDFAKFNFGWIRAKVIAPTQGGLYLKIKGLGINNP